MDYSFVFQVLLFNTFKVNFKIDLDEMNMEETNLWCPVSQDAVCVQ